MQDRELDAFDLKILDELSKDGRVSWRDLADRIGLSFSPTLRRVRRLEEEGTIRGYTASIDEKRVLGSVQVFISVTLERQVKEILTRFEAKVEGMPEVIGGFLISGSSDYLLHAVVRDLAHYQAMLDQLTTIDGVARIQSNFAVKSFIRRSAPLIRETGS
ncbi:AsnC family transcriptional regulator [Azorhizobium oxalatiphilum]|uniref:AsnC family transcriptional regulator n=1 Tax=Azorhizobium oxalatiphilum TaxID=980631 RepID=A0A917BSL3_9HYPH|nr:Lrp/AsnC family transcriptional regulator [Azorhizobium oxalatiphilum]GGF55300.1 AsnC family transcriptional regulator [Azorhizobium oxalatiphilum]